MADILVVAEIVEGQVKKATYSAVAFARDAAKALGGSYDILAIGQGADKAAAELGGYGARKVLVADDASLKGYVTERFAPIVAAAGKSHAVVGATATTNGKDLMPRVAAKLGAGYAPDITGFKAEGGKLQYKRPMYAGNAYGWLTIETPIQLVTVRQTDFTPAEPSGGASAVEKVAVVADKAADQVEFVAFETIKSERPDLTEAKVIIAGGRAIKEKFMDVLGPLADTLGAAIGATRAACDAGFAPTELQIGQTGKVVAPQLYVAVGISGAIQHLAGMKGSKTIVAINKDPEAPIFQVADYGLVADLFQVMPELTTAVKAAKS
ncbi:MAG: electron transfer flavoprotein subunit alpha/FixB family protein [Deltaproteobacteria bacterium]|nr:electron transfer flavoprotein subunit alpha/FixB family protein [Deltaproteobacteria bacterium]